MNEKKVNIMYLVNIMFFILVMQFNILYIKVTGLVFKAIASALFLVLGGINLYFVLKNKVANKKFSIIILVGLFFAMLGDILLEINFMIGAIFFAIGHIFFFVSYCFLNGFKATDLIYGLVIIVPAVLLITLAPFFDFGGIVMEILCICYAVIISFMLGKALANFVKNKNAINLVILLGSFLFFFSDLMLLFNVFSNIGGSVFGCLCLGTYYPAEVLLALSILINCVFSKNENESQEDSLKTKNK